MIKEERESRDEYIIDTSRLTHVYIMGSNYTADSADVEDDFTVGNVVIVVVLSVFCLSGVFGNILVCLAVWKIRTLRVVGNYFVVSLAVADVLVSGLVMPLAISLEVLEGKWIFGKMICYAWTSLDVTLSTASIINLGAISVDRYRAVTQPLSYASKRTAFMARKVIIIVWVVSVIVGAPATIFIDYSDGVCFLSDKNARYYSIISSCFSFFIPCFIILFLYYKIFKTAQFRANRRVGPAIAAVAVMYPKRKVPAEADQQSGGFSETQTVSNRNQSVTWPTETPNLATKEETENRSIPRACENNVLKSQKKISVAKERKAAVVLMIVVGTFVACWLPFFTINVAGAICTSCEFGPKLMSFVLWLGWCNSIVNPALYTVFNKEFRNAFKKLLRIDRCFNS
ncbi:probable G-protein coupled receptor No18 [Antedon mediterranea]|uniref:probable G-protein coupled receptor No18 n=1 Tax=Antedon mediterranea TaxID=105859 RepID=UPI003AF71829